MKGKIINLFQNKTEIQNEGLKYSKLLEQFIAPFASEFANVEFYEDVIDLGITAWNFGNMNTILPSEAVDVAFSGIKDVEGAEVDVVLLKKMIDYKLAEFKEYTNFIVDFEIEEENGETVLTVVTQEQDVYLTSMFESLEEEDMGDDYEENYIDRSAITLKPLKPFLDWRNHLYPDDIDEENESSVYLVSDEVEDVEIWLKKNFDRLFVLELEAWHTNEKEWPRKRNYKMFKQWFQVNLSAMVYDLEKEPVSK